MDEPTRELQAQGHFKLSSGDYIGWAYNSHRPVYSRASNGSGITTSDNPQQAIGIARADLIKYEEHCRYLRTWIEAAEEEYTSPDDKRSKH